MNKRHENTLAVQRCCREVAKCFYSRSASAELHVSPVASQFHLLQDFQDPPRSYLPLLSASAQITRLLPC